MQNQEECGASCEFDDWSNIGDDDIMQQQSDIKAEEAQKIAFVADKVSLQTKPIFYFILFYSLFSDMVFLFLRN